MSEDHKPSFKKPLPGKYYAADGYGSVAITTRHDLRGRYNVVGFTGCGHGGTTFGSKKVLTWPGFLDASQTDREKTVSHPDYLVVPPEGWADAVVKSCKAYLNPTNERLSKDAIEADTIEIPTEYAEAAENSHEYSFEEPEDVVENPPRPGEIYLAKRDSALVMSRPNKKGTSAEIRVNPKFNKKIQIGNYKVLSFKDAAQMDEERAWEYENNPEYWVQPHPSWHGNLIHPIRAFLSLQKDCRYKWALQRLRLESYRNKTFGFGCVSEPQYWIGRAATVGLKLWEDSFGPTG